MMTLLDVDKIHELEKKIFTDAWSRDAFISEVNNKLAHYFLFEIDDVLIGYGGVWIILDEGHITNIAIDSDYRGCGYGYYLVNKMIQYLKENGVVSATLEVRVSNTPAIKLYEKCGFKGAGVRKKYYQDNGEDALIMWAEF